MTAQSASSSVQIRRAASRGQTTLAWLQSWHSFSFGRYIDRTNMNFGPLRVINEDIVAPGAGFGLHPHDNMEILTWMVSGSLAHRDSTGSAGIITPGEVQLMSAGSGIEHSELNPSATDPAHLLQIWIRPAQRDCQPRYQQRRFERDARLGAWQLIADPDGADGALTIGQDARVRIADLAAGHSLALDAHPDRIHYVHTVFGSVEAVSVGHLSSGDALTIERAGPITLRSDRQSQVIWFDMVRD